MRTVEFWIFAYLVNSLWQLPLLFAAAWLASRALRPLGARMEHRLWVLALVLESLLPALSALPWAWLGKLLGNRIPVGAGEAQVAVLMGTGLAAPAGQGAFLLAIIALYVAVTAFFAARFLYRAANLAALRREAVPLQLPAEAAQFWVRCLKILEAGNVSIAASSRVSGPVTLGIRRKLLLVPASLAGVLADADFETVIAHEFAHMHRQDFLKNLLYELLSLPVSFHPLLWLTRARIMESREMVCDRIAAQVTGGSEYARSLLRLASMLIAGGAGRTPHTIGIFDANVFERRLMNVTEKSQRVTGMRRVALLAASAALGIATCASAVALGTHVNAAPVSAGSNASKTPERLTVSAQEMSGNLLTKAMPIYPPAAKKDRIQGKVVLDTVIGTDGNVESVRALSGPQELQQSAVDAVRQWKYKPYVMNGQPVEVETTINIIYSLNG